MFEMAKDGANEGDWGGPERERGGGAGRTKACSGPALVTRGAYLQDTWPGPGCCPWTAVGLLFLIGKVIGIFKN